MPLNTAISKVGSVSALASILGVSPQVVINWRLRGRVPSEYCIQIERATDGEVRCESIRPDMDWAYLRATDCKAA